MDNKTLELKEPTKENTKNSVKKPKKFPYYKKKSEFLTYKGKPLVRCGDTLYYGSMNKKYVVKIDIEEKEKDQDGLEKATKLFVQLTATNMKLGAENQVVKTAYRDSLYKAIDLADTWISRIIYKKTKAFKRSKNKILNKNEPKPGNNVINTTKTDTKGDK